MSKKKAGKQTRRGATDAGRRRALLTISLALTLIAGSGALALRSGILSAGQKQGEKSAEVTPASMLPGSPSKEYVYAGSRLVATEEPAGTPGCTFSISPVSQPFGSSGGTGNVTVTAGAGCGWIATSNAQWIHVTSGASGTGPGTVGYSVDLNSGSARSGTMTIASQTFTINQDPASSCSYSISPASQNFIAAGGTGSVNVTTVAGCSWTASSNAGWITVQPPGSGTGSGSVTYSVAANSGVARSGTMAVAGQTFTVTQDAGGSSCSYSISPTSGSIGAGGGTGSVNVTASAGCSWTATSNAGWITVQPPGSGTGNGTVTYSVSSNTGAARNGTMTIAGQTFTVNQNAAGGPPAPTNVTATALTATSIRVDWSFVPDGISIFKIERKTGTNGTYAQIASADTGTRTFTNTKLTTHTTYCYRVRAYNGQDGPYSNEACATTP